MLENLSQPENEAIAPPEIKRWNSNDIIDLESFLKDYKGNIKHDASIDFLQELKIQILSKLELIRWFTEINTGGLNKGKLKFNYSSNGLKEDIESMKLFIKNDYGLLNGNEKGLIEYITAIEEYKRLIGKVSADQDKGHKLYEELNIQKEIIKSLCSEEAQKSDSSSRELYVRDIVLDAVYKADKTIKKVRGSFNCQANLPLIAGNGSTRLIFEYLIRKSLVEGSGMIYIRSKLHHDGLIGKIYVATTISPYWHTEDIVDRRTRYINNVLSSNGGTIIPDESEITLCIKVREDKGYAH